VHIDLLSYRFMSNSFFTCNGNCSIPVSQNLTGWVFAFVVSLDLQAAAIDNLPQSVKDVLLTPENYTVQRLLVDFTSESLLQLALDISDAVN
jgi:hypothetical protein